jgi:hypothetical protein
MTPAEQLAAGGGHQQRVNEAFEFRGAASVILESIVNVATTGEIIPGTRLEPMTARERLDFIAGEAGRLLARATI